jgi:hypothetical protein
MNFDNITRSDASALVVVAPRPTCGDIAVGPDTHGRCSSWTATEPTCSNSSAATCSFFR